ncbi:sugar ABC transporter substrate-binding protein [Cohnella nanjingensis]|uniref:Sugar ABC transporter substrate-binding protein n=1 Tax=Cohnella nanjingensis TaxID=1387779 RepID=A0A7X0VFJ7_9BACL|nr:sugar ABC transporter substrate-binding protein [Cohnella nanjingensis]MBB6672112.1 sugar ABC transporter substrate-binding protein [Cohnella nanjingensis]
MFTNNKTKKAVTLIASTALMAGVLAGCGASNGDGGKGGKVTLNVWGMGDEAKSLPAMAEKFQAENPNITVKIQAIPWATAHDKLLTAVASKKGPDVVQMGTTWIPEFAAAGALMDLSGSLDQYPSLKQENFFDGSLNTTKYDNKIVGVPWYIDTRVLYYRTDLLASVGYNEAPKTWDELSDAAQKLAKRGKGKYGITLDPKEQTLSFMFARQNGSKLLDDQGKPLFNQPEFVEAVKYLNSFYQNGSAPKEDLGLDPVQAFKGDAIVPMFISGPWMVKPINDQAPELKDKWATAVLPKKENNISNLGGSNWSVFQYTKEQEASLKFIDFMSKPETQIEWMKLANAMPAAKAAWDDPFLKENTNLAVFGEQMKNAEPMPLIKAWEEISQNYLSSFEKIFRGGADIQKTLDEFNQTAAAKLGK